VPKGGTGRGPYPAMDKGWKYRFTLGKARARKIGHPPPPIGLRPPAGLTRLGFRGLHRTARHRNPTSLALSQPEQASAANRRSVRESAA